MAFGLRFWGCRLGRRGVAGDEAEALATGVEAVALEDCARRRYGRAGCRSTGTRRHALEASYQALQNARGRYAAAATALDHEALVSAALELGASREVVRQAVAPLPRVTRGSACPIRLIQTGNVGIGQSREQGFRYIDESSFDELRCTEIDPGDVLICRLADPVGRACLAPDLGVRMITSVDVCILKASEQFSETYLVFLLSCKRYLDYVESLVRGGTRDRIRRSMRGATRSLAVARVRHHLQGFVRARVFLPDLRSPPPEAAPPRYAASRAAA